MNLNSRRLFRVAILLLLVMPHTPSAASGGQDVALRDAARDRAVPVKVYSPASSASCPCPLIVFSPGFGGSRDGYAYLGQGWSDAGYIVIVLTHLGSDQDAVRRYGATLARDAGAAYRLQVDRTADVTYVLNALATIEREVPSLRGRIDAQRIGVAGHSMGAGTALLIGGANATPPEGATRTFRDARVRAVVAMSPQGAGEEGFTDRSWTDVRLPVMTMSGTLDGGIAGQPPGWRLEAFQHLPPPGKFQVIVKGARHLSFATGEAFHPCILEATLGFWDRFLKQDRARSPASSGVCAVTSK